MTRPVLAIGVSHKDVAQAIVWLRWLSFFTTQPGGSMAGESMLIFITKRVERERGQIALASVCGPWSINCSIAVCPDEDERGYPASASHLFLRLMEYCEQEYPNRPVLFCEPDCIPVRPTWFQELAIEYESNGGNGFMGAQVDHKALDGWHMSGNGCYARNWRELIPSLLTVLDLPDHHLWGAGRGQPWDVAITGEVRNNFHRTDSIQQIFHGPAYTPKNLHLVQPATALHHRSKDGSLIATLARTRYPSFASTLPPCSRYFCMNRHPAQFKVSGYDIEGWREVKRPSGKLYVIAPTDPLDELVLSCLVGSKGISELTPAEWDRLA